MVILQPIWRFARFFVAKFFVAKFFVALTLSFGLCLSWQVPGAAAQGVLSVPSSLGVVRSSAFHFSGDRPTFLGLSDGYLADCPDTPNCVNSEAQDSEHQIAPLAYDSVQPRKAMQALKQVIDDTPGAEVIRAEEGYIYAEFSSRLMGFVDDVEFAFDAQQQQINVRSASRLGQSDLGVNRQRIETLRAEFEALLASTT